MSCTDTFICAFASCWFLSIAAHTCIKTTVVSPEFSNSTLEINKALVFQNIQHQCPFIFYYKIIQDSTMVENIAPASGYHVAFTHRPHWEHWTIVVIILYPLFLMMLTSIFITIVHLLMYYPWPVGFGFKIGLEVP